MPHQDHPRATAPAAHHQDLRAVLDWLVADADFAGVRFRGTCTWTPRALACAALLWAWSAEAAVTERFTAARKVAVVTLGLSTLTATTYQAFLKILRAAVNRSVSAASPDQAHSNAAQVKPRGVQVQRSRNRAPERSAPARIQSSTALRS